MFRVFLEGEREPVRLEATIIAALGSAGDHCDRAQRAAYVLDENGKTVVECQP